MQKLSKSCDSWSDILAEARRRAQTGHRDKKETHELHVAHGEAHAHGKDCWCAPEIHYVDPDTGIIVFAHRRIQ